MKFIGEKLENKFWNNESIVQYFYKKPADFRIATRLQKINNRDSLKALDLGCGAGRHAQLLCELGFQMYACDINHSMLEATKNRVSKYFNKKDLLKRIVYGDILKLPFPNAFFGVVIVTGVLHQAHSLADYKKAIKELSRILKPGGKVFLNIFTNKILDPTLKPIMKKSHTVLTKENLFMTLLPKRLFYRLMRVHGLRLEEEISEDIKNENTGQRAVLRANFMKDPS